MEEIIAKYFITKFFFVRTIANHVAFNFHSCSFSAHTKASYLYFNLNSCKLAKYMCCSTILYICLCLRFHDFFLVATHVFCMKQFSSFSFCMHFIPFPCFTEVSRSSNVMLNRSKRKNLCLILDI